MKLSKLPFVVLKSLAKKQEYFLKLKKESITKNQVFVKRKSLLQLVREQTKKQEDQAGSSFISILIYRKPASIAGFLISQKN